MNETTERIARLGNLELEAGWKIIEWCAENGGDEFSFQSMRSGEDAPVLHDRIKTALGPFSRGDRDRELLTVMAGQKKRCPIPTWRLNPGSIEILQREVPQGFFTEPALNKVGWFEDFTIFRRGEIMLGVVSHESYAVLRLTGKEQAAVPGLKLIPDKKC